MTPKYIYTPDPDDVAIEAVFTSHGLPFKDYTLVNNYGWVVTTPRGHRVDVRHVLNVYGVSVDQYDIDARTPSGSLLEHQTYSDIKTVIQYLNALLTTLTV
jgi:hypothetical protein